MLEGLGVVCVWMNSPLQGTPLSKSELRHVSLPPKDATLGNEEGGDTSVRRSNVEVRGRIRRTMRPTV